MRFKLTDLPPHLRAQVEKQAAPAANPSKPAPTPRLRQKQGDGLNKTEREFYEVLKANAGEHDTIKPHGMTLEIANGCKYTPDFTYIATIEGAHIVSLSFYEVKGPRFWDDAKVKIKVAARTYKFARFYLNYKTKDGTWHQEEILP